MWEKVDFDNMAGKILLHGGTYRVRDCEREFNAVFNYCEYEYWWTCARTGKEVTVKDFKISQAVKV